MYKEQKIGVVVPAYNEEELILETLGGIPDYADSIFVINDASADRTLELIEQQREKDPRVHPINHETNKGLGQSLIDGYVAARDSDVDITAVMAGDNQMHPDDLVHVLDPIADGHADYVKGNRLLQHDVAKHMPTHRLLGNAALTFLTKFAAGYWGVVDPQCGYTAISKEALTAIPIRRMTQGYGYNADILNMLNIANFVVADVAVRPVYGREQSKIKLWKYIPRVSCLLVRLFWRRLVNKCLVRDFNPLFLSYVSGLLLFFLGVIPFAVRLVWKYSPTGEFPQTTLICLMFLTIASLQILLAAIQNDMLDNRGLFFHAGRRRPDGGGGDA